MIVSCLQFFGNRNWPESRRSLLGVDNPDYPPSPDQITKQSWIHIQCLGHQSPQQRETTDIPLNSVCIGGSKGAPRPPLGPKFFHFHAAFGKHFSKQECIPVRCVLPTCWLYPTMHCRGVYLPGGYLPLGGGAGVSAQGVPAWGCICLGVYLPRGCTCLGGTCQEVYLPRGCTCWGCTYLWGVPAWGLYLPGGCTCLGVPAQVLPLWTEWQTGAKILPCPKLRLRAVIIG